MEGYVLDLGYCVPCPAGCGICSASNMTLCLTCSTGFFKAHNDTCEQCSSNCLWCSFEGCYECAPHFNLIENGTCAPECEWPCATCAPGHRSICKSCEYGYHLKPSTLQSCEPDIPICNDYHNCTYCPPGYTLVSNSTTSTTSSSCMSCNSNCQRCLASDPNHCTSCVRGFYPNYHGQCVNCKPGCSDCASYDICFACSVGYFPQLPSANLTALNTQSQVRCMACAFPCASCLGTSTCCLSCMEGYDSVGQHCVTNYHYIVVVVLAASLQEFS